MNSCVVHTCMMPAVWCGVVWCGGAHGVAWCGVGAYTCLPGVLWCCVGVRFLLSPAVQAPAAVLPRFLCYQQLRGGEQSSKNGRTLIMANKTLF